MDLLRRGMGLSAMPLLVGRGSNTSGKAGGLENHGPLKAVVNQSPLEDGEHANMFS
jgi:hypothetical protein